MFFEDALFLGLATSNVRHADGMVVLRPHLVAGFVQLLQTAAELLLRQATQIRCRQIRTLRQAVEWERQTGGATVPGLLQEEIHTVTGVEIDRLAFGYSHQGCPFPFGLGPDAICSVVTVDEWPPFHGHVLAIVLEFGEMVHPDPVGRVEPVNRRRGAELSCERVEEDDPVLVLPSSYGNQLAGITLVTVLVDADTNRPEVELDPRRRSREIQLEFASLGRIHGALTRASWHRRLQ